MQKILCGVYYIRHLTSGKIYVGQAKDVGKRWSVHKFHLNNGSHHCSHLQRSWKKYGQEQFEFEFVEQCDESVIDRQEIVHYNLHIGKLFNTRPAGKSARGFKLPKAACKKISACQKIIGADPEERKRRSERCKKQHVEGRIKYSVKKKKRKQTTCSICFTTFYNTRDHRGVMTQRKFCRNCKLVYKRPGNRKPHTEEARALIGIAARKAWKNPERREAARISIQSRRSNGSLVARKSYNGEHWMQKTKNSWKLDSSGHRVFCRQER